MTNNNKYYFSFIRVKLGIEYFIFKYKKLIVPIFCILTYVLFYFLIDFSSQSLVAHDEGLYARRARLIHESNNWFESPFDKPHHKTLGSYWLIALSIKLLGINEFSVRLPSILFSFICIFLFYLISLRISNKKTALITILSLSSSPLWIQYSRYSSPDIQFVLCILLIIYFFIEFLNSTTQETQFKNIFLSGFFISISFFIRSYMIFVPLIGLLPFLLSHLLRSKDTLRRFFFFGIFIGFIPTCFNLYFEFKTFGYNAVFSLFDFAKYQAIGESSLNNFFLIPLKLLYLTFPVGLLFLLLIALTKTNYKVRYPLLVYCYPSISFIILLFMSKSYPHYYLFLLPSLSLLFAIHVNSYSLKFSYSGLIFKSLLFSILLSLIVLISFFNYFYIHTIYDFSNIQTIIIYFASTALIISYLLVFYYLLRRRLKYKSILPRALFTIIIPQYLSLSLLYNFGILGSPNIKAKSFLNDPATVSIINNNTIYLYNLDTKLETLLSFYLPSSKVLTTLNNKFKYEYLITTDFSDLNKKEFIQINSFSDNFLLMNISK